MIERHNGSAMVHGGHIGMHHGISQHLAAMAAQPPQQHEAHERQGHGR